MKVPTTLQIKKEYNDESRKKIELVTFYFKKYSFIEVNCIYPIKEGSRTPASKDIKLWDRLVRGIRLEKKIALKCYLIEILFMISCVWLCDVINIQNFNIFILLIKNSNETVKNKLKLFLTI